MVVQGTHAANVRRAGWLALVAAVLTLGLIAYGSWVRVSGSGLGCPDWPLCEGVLVPEIEGATAIEFGHRVYAGITMLLVAGFQPRSHSAPVRPTCSRRTCSPVHSWRSSCRQCSEASRCSPSCTAWCGLRTSRSPC